MNNSGPTKSEIASSSDRTVFSLIQAAHAAEDRLETALGRAGLSIPKYSVLTELVSAGAPLSLGELATRLSCVKSNMTQLVDRLEADGLVERVDDPADRRSVKAAITERGRAKQEAGAGEVQKVHEDVAALIGDGDRAAVERLLLALK